MIRKIILALTCLSYLLLRVSCQCAEVRGCNVKANDQLLSTNLDEYYEAITDDLQGEDLKKKLNEVISSPYINLNYDCVWKALEDIDRGESVDTVSAFYSKREIVRLNRVCNENMSDENAWNREHVWPISRAFREKSQYAYTDIHHLVPADKSINNKRANKDFQNGGSRTDVSDCNECKSTDNTFEPPDDLKGVVARKMLYMDTRYEGGEDEDREGTPPPDFKLVNRLTNQPEDDPSLLGFLSTLLEWHCIYPVSDDERTRNDDAQKWQGNRNPFIDRPEYVKAVWNGAEFDDIWNCEPITNPPVTDPEPPTNGDAGQVWINEIHYDDAGSDNDEFIEIGCNKQVDVTGFRVVLYNGNNGLVYNEDEDSATLSGVCSPVDNFIVYSPTGGIQNGGPDGIALIDSNELVIQFISYEGFFTAGNGPAESVTSVDIGVSENGSTIEGESLQLVGEGCGVEDFTWKSGIVSTKGSMNNGQNIGCESESEPEAFPEAESAFSSFFSFLLSLFGNDAEL